MLTQDQLMDWFKSNGIDIGVRFPSLLLGRIFKKAVSYDTALLPFLGNSCFTPHNKDLLVLNFQNWNELFNCYKSYNASNSIMKA